LAEKDIDVIMIAGNHDTYFKNTNEVNSPELLLREYKNIQIIDEAVSLDVHGTEVCFVPWVCTDNFDHSMQTMKDTSAEICMGHFEIAGFAMYRGMQSNEGFTTDTFKKFDLVFSGHYHHRSNDNHIYYLGNPYELTWQDYNDPRGFHLFDLNTRSLDFIQNPYTMFARLEYDDTGVLEDLDTLDLQGKYVKLVVVNKTDYYKFDKYIQKLYTKACAEIKIVEDLSEFNEGEVSSDINLEDTLDVLSNYIDSVQTDADKEKIKTFMRTLYTEAVNIEV
jgi:DNA repair exonuclease SbcCD nuclease subunit